MKVLFLAAMLFVTGCSTIPIDTSEVACARAWAAYKVEVQALNLCSKSTSCRYTHNDLKALDRLDDAVVRECGFDKAP